MRFGSVEFFKVLIKTVLAIVFFAPLVTCVVLAIILANKNAETDRLKQENQRVSLAADILVGTRTGNVENYYELYKKSGLSYDELINYIYEQEGGSASVREFYELYKKSGLAFSELIGYINEREGTSYTNKPDDPAPPETTDVPVTQSTAESSTPSSEEGTETSQTAEEQSPYAMLYEDMTVSLPENTVREEGTVYFTFDDGPSVNTYSILSYLRKYNVKATFFVVPTRTEDCYAALRQIVNDGHSIGVHSASHDYEKIYASVEAFLDDFYEAWDIIYDATGVKTGIFRFPGGSKNDFNNDTRDDIIVEMTRRGFRYFDWNVESGDADGADWSQMYQSVLSDINGNVRSVVLMHDSAPRENTVLVFEDILKVLIDEKKYKIDKINDDTRPVQFVGPYA